MASVNEPAPSHTYQARIIARLLRAPVFTLAANQGSPKRIAGHGGPRCLADPDAVIARLLDWSDAAHLLGRVEQADKLLLLAWEAYSNKLASAASAPPIQIQDQSKPCAPVLVV